MRHQTIKPRPPSTKTEPEARLGSVPGRGCLTLPVERSFVPRSRMAA